MGDVHGGFQTQPAQLQSWRTRVKHTAAKAKSTEKGVERREGTDAATHREAARADPTPRQKGSPVALSGPGPAGSHVRLVAIPSRPTPPHRLFVVRRTNGLLGSPHAVQHKYSTSSGRPAPGPEASCPGNASLRHLRSFSDPPTPGRRRERSRPTSEC